MFLSGWWWYGSCLYTRFAAVDLELANLQRTYRNSSMTVFVSLIHLYCLWLWQLWYYWSYDLSLWCSIELYAHGCYRLLFIWDYLDCWCIWWCDDYLPISIMYYSYCIIVCFNPFSCSQLDPLICSLIPPDTSYILKNFYEDNSASSQYTDYYGYSVLNMISYLIRSNIFSILYPLPHPVSPIIVTDVRHPHT